MILIRQLLNLALPPRGREGHFFPGTVYLATGTAVPLYFQVCSVRQIHPSLDYKDIGVSNTEYNSKRYLSSLPVPDTWHEVRVPDTGHEMSTAGYTPGSGN